MTSARNKSRATSYDVARLAGVSQSAVSRCFKEGASISKPMRRKVMSAAKRLNYQPNAIARGLVTRRSNLVALIVSSQLNFYYPEVLFSLTESLSAQGMRALLFAVDSASEIDQSVDQLRQYQADGVISIFQLSAQQYESLKGLSIPVILFNRYIENHPSNYVWCDTEAAVTQLIDELVELGHQQFALLAGPGDSSVSQDRMRIVNNILRSHDVDSVIEIRGDFKYESGVAAVHSLFASKSKPTAIIAANDMMAMGVMDELRRVMDVSVPGDISVVGFDGISATQFASYELTTIRQPIDQMSEAAVSMLMSRVEDPDISDERRVLSGILLKGLTIGKARSE